MTWLATWCRYRYIETTMLKGKELYARLLISRGIQFPDRVGLIRKYSIIVRKANESRHNDHNIEVFLSTFQQS